jgi:hypothetical protein
MRWDCQGKGGHEARPSDAVAKRAAGRVTTEAIHHPANACRISRELVIGTNSQGATI